MAEKLNIDDEKKLISLRSYIGRIKNKQIIDSSIKESTTRLVDVQEHLLTPLGITIYETNRFEKEFYEQSRDELLGPLYQKDPDWYKMDNYIRSSNRKFLLQEKILYKSMDYIVELLEIIGDSEKTAPIPTYQPEDDGTPRLNSDEREEIKRRAHQLIIHYKKVGSAKQKTILLGLNRTANTKEKFNIINDVFFELTGERALEKMRQTKEKTEEVENFEPEQTGPEQLGQQ